MLDFFINNTISYVTYVESSALPLFSSFPVAIYFSSIIWVLSLVLSASASTRANLTNPTSRTSVNSTLVSLYKL